MTRTLTSLPFLIAFLLFRAVVCDASPVFLGEDFVADSLPVDADKGGKNRLFFWLFKSRDGNKKAPLVVFINGGPGSSGEEVALNENGPYRVAEDLTLTKNVHSYNNFADVMYLDQPIGTGFSTQQNDYRIPPDQPEVAKDLAAFFTEFYNKYPAYKHRRTFFTGQSFAGHFIPGTVAYLARNVADMNVRGVSVGNGAMSLGSYMRSNAYAKFALARNMVGKLGYLLSSVMAWVGAKMLDMGMDNSIFTLLFCSVAKNIAQAGMSSFDYTWKCVDPVDCYDFGRIYRFMARPDVLAELGVAGKTWTYTADAVNNAMLYDNLKDYSTGLKDLLAQNISVTLYYGDNDFTCNHEGGLAWLAELGWSESNSLLQQKHVPLKLANGTTVGLTQGFGLMNYVQVFGCGHFVALSCPRVAPALLESMVGRGTYRFDYSLGLVTVDVGYPPQRLSFLISTDRRYSWVSNKEFCRNCDRYERLEAAKDNSTNRMGLEVREKYAYGELRGEVVYEMVQNARIPMVMASEAPDVTLPYYSAKVAGVLSFSLSSQEQNPAQALFLQGKAESSIVSIYGFKRLLTIGGYDTTYDKTLFWVGLEPAAEAYCMQTGKVSFGKTVYGSGSTCLRLEQNAISLPRDAYETLFMSYIKGHRECRRASDQRYYCIWKPGQIEELPRFVVTFAGTEPREVVVHPTSYVTRVGELQYRINVVLGEAASVGLGANILDRVYVVLNPQERKVGFVNFDS